MTRIDDPFDIGRFSLDPKNAWTLAAPYFYAPEVHEAETRAIFLRSWRFLGHVSQVQNPGDYLTGDICGPDVGRAQAALAAVEHALAKAAAAAE